jgi:hypothetical protein
MAQSCPPTGVPNCVNLVGEDNDAGDTSCVMPGAPPPVDNFDDVLQSFTINPADWAAVNAVVSDTDMWVEVEQTIELHAFDVEGTSAGFKVRLRVDWLGTRAQAVGQQAATCPVNVPNYDAPDAHVSGFHTTTLCFDKPPGVLAPDFKLFAEGAFTPPAAFPGVRAFCEMKVDEPPETVGSATATYYDATGAKLCWL